MTDTTLAAPPRKGRAAVQRTQAGQASIIATMAERWGCSPEVLQGTILKTCLKGPKGFAAQPEHVVAFLIIAREYELNPFMGEIQAFVKDGAVCPIIGIDGRVTLINRQPDYDGVAFEWVYEDGRTTPESMADLPLACTCTIYNKNRSHPTTVTEFFSECKRNTGPWGQHPRRMLRHKAFIQCGRVAFGLRMYDEEDFTELQDADVIETTLPTPAPAMLDMKAGPDSIPRRTADPNPKPEVATAPAPEFSEPTTTVPVDPPATEVEDGFADAKQPDPTPDAPKRTPVPNEATMRKDIDARALEMADGDSTTAQAFVKEWSAGLSDKMIEGWPIGTVVPKKYLPEVSNRSKAAHDEWETQPDVDSNGELELK